MPSYLGSYASLAPYLLSVFFFLKEEREGLVSGLGVEVDNLMHSGLSYPEYFPDAFFHFSNWRNIFLQLGK